MKRTLLLLTILGLFASPLMVSQAEAAPVRHHAVVKHHKTKKQVKKHAKRIARRHHRKVAV